jgi:hypothetical protein
MNPPAPFVPIDAQADFRIRWRVIDWLLQDEEIRRQLSDWQDITIDAQLQANVSGIAGTSRGGSTHE